MQRDSVDNVIKVSGTGHVKHIKTEITTRERGMIKVYFYITHI